MMTTALTLSNPPIDFSRVSPKSLEKEILESLEKAKEELAFIANSNETPTFANTFESIESLLGRMIRPFDIFKNLLSADTNDELDAIASSLLPKVSVFFSDLLQNEKLYGRCLKVTAEGEDEKRVIERTLEKFRRNGTGLPESTKAEIKAIDEKMSSLTQKFAINARNSRLLKKFWIDDLSHLAGIPQDSIDAFKKAADEDKEKKAPYLVTLDGPSYMAVVKFCTYRPLREQVWKAQHQIGLDDANSNKALCFEIAEARQKRAELLGFKHHSEYVLKERMVGTPEKLEVFLHTLYEAYLPAANRDAREIAEALQTHELRPWDLAHGIHVLKQTKYQFNESDCIPYFELNKCLDGVFEVMRRLYSMTVTPRTDLTAYHPDVKVFEVKNSKGDLVSFLYTDLFPRKSKKSGAWMTDFYQHGLVDGKMQIPHVAIVCNFPKPNGANPALLQVGDVRTLFHEMGHALHFMFSKVKYPSLNEVEWDYVELPSQIFENWLNEPEVLNLFATHYKTGEKMPKALIDKMIANTRVGSAITALRQMHFANIDLMWHSGPKYFKSDLSTIERDAWTKTMLFDFIEGLSISTGFQHIFSGGYSAGYYSYKWAEVLEADAFKSFKENGVLNPEMGQKFFDTILSQGGRRPAASLFRAFKGRDPDHRALLEKEGVV